MRRAERIQRVVIWMATVAYAIVASGLPLPMGRGASDGRAAPGAERRMAAKDRSTPFPCMDKPCGCATAEQCFSKCCCHTPAETLLWARAHRVAPSVIAALERRIGGSGSGHSQSSAGCCTAHKAATACCERKSSCCEEASPPFGNHATDRTPSRDACEKEHDGGEHGEPRRTGAVSLHAMLACGGIVSQWLAAAAALPPEVVACPLGMVVIESLPIADESGESPSGKPAAPPPRTA